jgi:hypothetical protein
VFASLESRRTKCQEVVVSVVLTNAVSSGGGGGSVGGGSVLIGSIGCGPIKVLGVSRVSRAHSDSWARKFIDDLSVEGGNKVRQRYDSALAIVSP